MMNPEELPIVTEAKIFQQLIKQAESCCSFGENDQALKLFDKIIDLNFIDLIHRIQTYPIALNVTVGNQTLSYGDYLLSLYRNVLLAKAELLIMDDDNESALRHLEQFEKEFPQNNSSLFYRLKVKTYSCSGDEKNALLYADKLIQSSPDDVKNYEIKAKILLATSQFAKAKDFLNSALQRNLSWSEIWMLKGLVHSTLHEHGEAAKAYEQVLSANPKEEKALYRVISAYTEIGEYQKARSHLKIFNALSNNKEHKNWLKSNLFSRLFRDGNAQSEKNNVDSALKCYELIIELEDTNQEFQQVKLNTLSSMGDIFCRKQDFDSAFKYYDAAINLNPTFTLPMLKKAFKLVELKRFAEAVPYMEKVLHLEPSNEFALDLKKILNDPAVKMLMQLEATHKNLFSSIGETAPEQAQTAIPESIQGKITRAPTGVKSSSPTSASLPQKPASSGLKKGFFSETKPTKEKSAEVKTTKETNANSTINSNVTTTNIKPPSTEQKPASNEIKRGFFNTATKKETTSKSKKESVQTITSARSKKESNDKDLQNSKNENKTSGLKRGFLTGSSQN